MTRARVLGATLLVVSTVAGAPGAGAAVKDERTRSLAELTKTLDALLALERKDGGWTFACAPGARPEPCTLPMRVAERLADHLAEPLGLARWDVVVLRSPGTPAAGLTLLGGHRLTRRSKYLAAARRAGDLLIAMQMPSGGWFSEMPVEEDKLSPWFVLTIRRTNIDDDVTTGAIRLLLALWETTKERRYRYAAVRGLSFLVRAQLASGAWPAMWRPPWKRALWGTFEDLATVNDAATPLAITTLAEAGRRLERADFVAAARRGADWLVRVRGSPPQAGWAQQYDAQGRPAPARRFEPAALASWESRYAIEALLAFVAATGEMGYCEPLPDAVAWLVRSAVEPGCWARFYDLKTNAPLYLDEAGQRVDTLAHARSGYDWTGDFGIPGLLARLGVNVRGKGGRALVVTGVPASAAARFGAPRLRLPGDPGTCPGAGTHPFERELSETRGDPRALIARAAQLLAALDKPPAVPCGRNPRWRQQLLDAIAAGREPKTR